MPKRRRKVKVSRQYPVAGKDDLNTLPATPTRRAACEVVRRGVAEKIQNQLDEEDRKKVGLARRAADARKLYADLDAQLRGLSK
jgi:hypothetical protein